MAEADPNDVQLVKAAQQGSEQAFRELMLKYIGSIYLFSKQYAKTEADAEDITQDTFFKSWKHLKVFDATKPFKPWLYAIARNTALDQIKRKKASSFSELDGDDTDIQFVDTLEDDAPMPNEEYERDEIRREVSKALDHLNPEHKSVMLMHYKDDLTFNEIADIVKKPMNTIKSWHRRSLNKIKKFLDHRKDF